MVETHNFRKNKINLEDYDYRKDIQNRLLLADLTSLELEILEEVICRPLKFSIQELVDQLDIASVELFSILEKFSRSGLFAFDQAEIIVDKEMRKYFEMQLTKFEENFIPGMDFLQTLLKKVPIHVLPNWYPIPRTSNNIFDSLVEKYLITPHTFQRYLSELTLNDPISEAIVRDLFAASNYKISAKEIQKKYQLSEEEFEKQLLYLEFNFVCCLVYEKQGQEWMEVVTLFQEWKDYLSFLKETQPKAIERKKQVQPFRKSDFSYIEDLSFLLSLAHKKSIFVRLDQNEEWKLEKEAMEFFTKEVKDLSSKFNLYCNQLVQKLLFLKLAHVENSRLFPTEQAYEWLTLPLEKQAINLYQQTLKHYPFSEFPSEICKERNIHEIEKNLSRIIGSDWVFLEDFLKGVIAPISEKSKMTLKKTGKYWKYTPPDYSEKEQELIRKVIYEWLFEAGMISRGFFEEKECLRITPFGTSMFG